MYDLKNIQTKLSDLRRQIQANLAARRDIEAQVEQHSLAARALSTQHSQISSTQQIVSQATKMLMKCKVTSQKLAEGDIYAAHVALQEAKAMMMKGNNNGNFGGYRKHHNNSNGNNKLQQMMVNNRSEYTRELNPVIANMPLIIDQLSTSLEQQCMTKFNAWLTSIRLQASEVGERGLQWAAASDAKKIELARLRKSLVKCLPSLEYAAAAADVASRVLQLEQQQQQQRQQQGPLPLLTVQQVEALEMEWLVGMDMSPLYQSVYLHSKLHKLQNLRQYYTENRKLQLSSDLTPPSFIPPAMADKEEAGGGGGGGRKKQQQQQEEKQEKLPSEALRSYLVQLLGHFIIEDEVARACPEIQIQAGKDTSWEAAASGIKASVSLALEATAGFPEEAISVKNLVVLTCCALERCGYPTTSIKEAVLGFKDVYCFDLADVAAETAQEAILQDKAQPLVVSTTKQAIELFRMLHLPATTTTSNRDTFTSSSSSSSSIIATFTECIPSTIVAVKSYVSAVASYVEGLLTPREALFLIRHQRDRLLDTIAHGALRQQVEEAASMQGGAAALPALLQWSGNISALLIAAAALDGFVLDKLRYKYQDAEIDAMTAASGVDDDQSTMITTISTTVQGYCNSSGLREVEQVVEEAAIAAIEEILGPVLDQALKLEWAPNRMPKTGGAWSPIMSAAIAELGQILKEIEGKAGSALSPTARRIAAGAFAAAADGFFGALLSSSVLCYNVFGLQMLLADLQALKQAAEKCFAADLAVKAVAAPEHFCELLLFGKSEQIVEEAEASLQRKSSFEAAVPSLDPYIAAELLDKYVDVPVGTAVHKLSPLTKMDAVQIAARLRVIAEQEVEEEEEDEEDEEEYAE
jgi:hypothetical protein